MKLLTRNWRNRKWYASNSIVNKNSQISFKERAINYSILNRVFTNNSGEIAGYENTAGEKIELHPNTGGKRGRKKKILVFFPKGIFTIKQVAELNNTSPANINNEINRLKKDGKGPIFVRKEKIGNGRGKPSSFFTFDSDVTIESPKTPKAPKITINKAIKVKRFERKRSSKKVKSAPPKKSSKKIKKISQLIKNKKNKKISKQKLKSKAKTKTTKRK